jgi:cytochrome c biogenesis protein CcmG, thiol:disulfide interchange protein DsbE
MAQPSGSGALLLGLVIVAGLYLTRDADQGRRAPDISLPDTYGATVDLASYRGQPLLLVFWSTSCGICRQELPLLSRLAPRFHSKGIEVMAIHLGGGDEARDYLASNHIDLRSLIDADGVAGRAYHVSGIPKLVLIGSDGIIKRTTAGMADETFLGEWMDAAGGS